MIAAPPRRTRSPRFTVRCSSAPSAVYGSPLCRPPRSRTVGRVMPRSATSVDATFVDFESLIQRTPSVSATPSMRCSSAWNPRSASAMRPAASAPWCAGSATITASVAGERVRDVVIAEERELRPVQELATEHDELFGRRIHVRVGSRAGREASARRRPRTPALHGGIVGVGDPARRGRRVAEEQPLVGVVLVDAAVAVEVVRREVREHADVWSDARACRAAGTTTFRARPSPAVPKPVAARSRRAASQCCLPRRAHAEMLKEMGGERRRRRLAVGAGDRDVPG